ncbi:YibE/F family protein [Lactobacillus terrae]|uniref:YibE/F family protein n=1 Tax=Lactobacillus terrae TaxID=2269374 RepID=UPI000C1B7208|nr:YibE/F family protein [Lactobacillus terrae]
MKNWVKIIIICLIGIAITALTRIDSAIYSDPIVQVTSVKTNYQSTETDEYKNEAKIYNQTITGKFLNTKDKGKTINLTNQYDSSLLMTQKYRVGQQLVVKKNSSEYSIYSQKRDTVVVGLISLVVLILFLMKYDRIRLFLSIVLNIIVFVIFMYIIINVPKSILLISAIITALLVTIISLVVILGPSFNALVAFLSTTISTTLAILLSIFLMYLSNNQNIHLEYSDYGLQPYFMVFISGVIFSVLGVIMDETMDITASLIEIKQEVPDVQDGKLFKSGMNIGRELVGPLINILLFIVVAEHLNIVFLYLSNGNSINYTIDMTLTLGIAQLLISSIGILITVPITSFIATKIINRRVAK